MLNASNTFAGNITLQNGGLLEYAAASALDPSATITLGNEGELAASDGSNVPNAITVSGGTDSYLSFTNIAGTFSGPITLNANLTVGLRNWYNYAGVVNGTISGLISGTAGLSINSGTGTGGILTLSGTSTFTGGTTVNSATVSISADDNLGADSSTLTLNGATLQTTSTNSMSFGHTIDVATGGGTISIVGNGQSNTGQVDKITLTSTNALTGSGPLTITGGGTLDGASPNTSTSGAGALIVDDAGTYTGNITLQNGGLLDFAAAGALPAGATVTLGNEAEFSTANGVTASNSIVVNGGTNSIISFSNLGGAADAGPITLNTNATIALRDWFNYADNRNGAISGAISGPGGLTINSGTGSGGTLTLTGPNSYAGGTTVVSGAKLLLGAAGAFPFNTPLTLSGGNAVLAQNVGTVTFSSLSITGNSLLDISNNQIIITYGSSDPIATIRGYIVSAFDTGYWTGPGLGSSLLISGGNYGLGYADGADGIVSGLSSGQIEVKYTLLGDANLDGVVNGSDFSILAANFGLGVTNWDQGNFFFTPSVNGSDFSALAQNFGQGDSGADATVSAVDIAALDAFAVANGLPLPAISSVPEPAFGAIVLINVCLALPRRRRGFKARAS